MIMFCDDGDAMVSKLVLIKNTGFLSSALLGTFVGPAADKFGRKRACLM
jgi:hypothetical protein